MSRLIEMSILSRVTYDSVQDSIVLDGVDDSDQDSIVLDDEDKSMDHFEI